MTSRSLGLLIVLLGAVVVVVGLRWMILLSLALTLILNLLRRLF